MVYFSRGSSSEDISLSGLRESVVQALGKLGERRRVLVIPPDFTRVHSQAGILTRLVREYYGDRLTAVLPALGTHDAMSEKEIAEMFGDLPRPLFHRHEFRTGLTTLGEVPAEYVHTVSEGRVTYPIPIQVNRLIAEGGHDLILSIGQVVPHEVVGMANYNKNLFVGAGGMDCLNRTHFLGAAYGMERIMGRADNPVRKVLNYGSEHFAQHLPVVYVLTVVARDASGKLCVRGLFVGDDSSCFQQAAALSLQVNFTLLEKPLKNVVVYLDPAEFKSTWLGNKSIYRTRMALADGGALTVLAPGVVKFGEDRGIDALIRKYGYVDTPAILEKVKHEKDLQENLSAAAHLIHGSSEGRFSITYCPGGLSRDEVESVNFRYADLKSMTRRYDPGKLRDGYNTLSDGEEIFYCSQPALGLWAYQERFQSASV
jgi:nickel-dependent lactate racemase